MGNTGGCFSTNGLSSEAFDTATACSFSAFSLCGSGRLLSRKPASLFLFGVDSLSFASKYGLSSLKDSFEQVPAISEIFSFELCLDRDL